MIDLSKIIRRVADENPLMPYIIKRCDITIGGTQSFYFYKNNAFCINISTEHAVDEETAVVVLSHEVSHVMFRADAFKDDFRRQSNPQLVNIAMDAIINEMLVDYNSSYEEVINRLKGVTLSLLNKQFNLNLKLNE